MWGDTVGATLTEGRFVRRGGSPCCELEEGGGGGVLEKETDGGGRVVSAWGMRFAPSLVSW